MIHSTALIAVGAKIGKGVTIGAYSIVSEFVEIGDDSVIESHCDIGHDCRTEGAGILIIGKSSLIRSHSVFYRGSSFGDSLVTGHRVTVREKTLAGKNLQIGTSSDIMGSCVRGDFVRLHSNVFVADHSKLGNFVWLFPGVVLTNDPHPPSEVRRGVVVGDYAAIAAKAVILPGVEIGQGALVAANSLVTRNVEADYVVAGSPARHLYRTDKIKLADGSGLPAYPWRRHFNRGYPLEYVKKWLNEFGSEP